MNMNYEKFCTVLEHIERNPDEWDQARGYWKANRCCFLAHARRIFDPDCGPYIDTWERGPRVLNADKRVGTWLYDDSRTLDDFRRVRHVMATRRLMAHAA
jgi:hypothetical protein